MRLLVDDGARPCRYLAQRMRTGGVADIALPSLMTTVRGLGLFMSAATAERKVNEDESASESMDGETMIKRH
jgi:hypothetical protein